MGKVIPHYTELAQVHYGQSIDFDALYVCENQKVNGGESNIINLSGERTIGVCFADKVEYTYVIHIAKNSVIKLFFFFEENTHSELHLTCAENASCEHFVAQMNGSYQIIQVNQSLNSTYDGKFFQLEGNKNVIKLNVSKDGENANTDLSGVFFPSKDEVYSIITKVSHKKPNCETNELFRGIADEKGSGTFSGLIYVAKDAQKTAAKQQNRNIVLTKDAHIHSEPQLEIYADDVVCNHGSSTGQIDEESLWYMQARGIDKTTALKLLVSGFANDVLQKILDDSVRDFFAEKIKAKLAQ